MKTRYKIALLIVALAFLLWPVMLFADDAVTPPATSAVSTNLNLPTVLAPIINLLPLNLKLIVVKILVWSASMSALLVWFRKNIDHWFRDKMNAAAVANGGGDAWLLSIYSAKWYRFIATVLAFLSISLPSASDLNRATKLQREAVNDAMKDGPTPPSVG